MTKLSISEVVNDYRGLSAIANEARRRRANVVKLVIAGRVSNADMADLLGITTSGVDQMVKAYKANHPSML